MSEDRLHGIRRALRLALLSGQSVNVGVNRSGSAAKLEGVIRRVSEKSFRIRLDTEEQMPEVVERIPIASVEYVEYS